MWSEFSNKAEFVTVTVTVTGPSSPKPVKIHDHIHIQTIKHGENDLCFWFLQTVASDNLILHMKKSLLACKLPLSSQIKK